MESLVSRQLDPELEKLQNMFRTSEMNEFIEKLQKEESISEIFLTLIENTEHYGLNLPILSQLIRFISLRLSDENKGNAIMTLLHNYESDSQSRFRDSIQQIALKLASSIQNKEVISKIAPLFTRIGQLDSCNLELREGIAQFVRKVIPNFQL